MKKFLAAALTLAAFAAAGTAPVLAQQTKHPVNNSDRGTVAHHVSSANVAPRNYSVGPEGGPLSPGGIGTAADSFRGPGYSGPSAY
jgi:hypothetical protein